MAERIVAAAVMLGDTGVYAATEIPGRHHSVMNPVAKFVDDLGMEHPIRLWGEQGFVTDMGRFVDRVEGLRIAEVAGQITVKHGNPGLLFSEDMW